MNRILVVGAGIGGLTTAAVLAKRGFDVTVLEAHVYPGGCAGTFYHQGYRFDAGATLAGGFYPGGPMDLVGQRAGVQTWSAELSDLAMMVHMPDGRQIHRWGDERRHAEMQLAFGDQSSAFWLWQERTADALWALAETTPTWPPQSPAQIIRLLREGTAWAITDKVKRAAQSIVADAFRSISSRIDRESDDLRLFIDGQLLISAQTTSQYANALYAASALDLPRRGVAHLQGGIGSIANNLAQALQMHGGRIHYRQEVIKITSKIGREYLVETRRGQIYNADMIVFNLPPWNIRDLLGEQSPGKINRLPDHPEEGWGAFMVYAGVKASNLPENIPLHQQVIRRRPLGEGNSVFLSLSPEWDSSRAPQGQRALTISTHTEMGQWWQLFANHRGAYEEKKAEYVEKVIESASQAIPQLGQAIGLVLPGTPVTFQRFTRRTQGWVGGFPQTSLFRHWGPRLSRAFWMVGDSIFPGQSTAAVALGGMRVANDVEQAIMKPEEQRLRSTPMQLS